MIKKLIIFGNGEIAELAKMYFEFDTEYAVEGFVVDDENKVTDEFCGLPLVGVSEVKEIFPEDQYVAHVALSYKKLNELRKNKFLLFKSMGYQLVSYVSSKCTIIGSVEFGDNCFILEDQTIQNGVKIGNNVVLWSGNHIGHGSVICDHAYLASHVVISGHCQIGERCFFGVNSATKDFLKIGDECFIGMGANVTRDLAKGCVVLDNPGKVLDAEDRIARSIKKKYFGV